MSSIFSKLFWRWRNAVTDSIQGVKKVNRCVSRLSIVILLMFSYSANGQIAPFDTDISLFIDRKSNLKSLLSVQDSNIIVGYLDAIDYFFYKNKSLIHFSSCMKRKYWPHEWKSMGEEEVGNINYEVLKSVDKAAKYIKRQYYIDTMSLSYFLIRFGMEIYFCDTVLRVLAESDEFITSLVSPDSYFVPPLSHLRSDMDGELFGIDRGYLLAVSAAEYVVSVVYGFAILQHVGLLKTNFCVPYSEEGTQRLGYAVVSALEDLPPDTTGDLRDLIVAELVRRVPCDEASMGAEE